MHGHAEMSRKPKNVIILLSKSGNAFYPDFFVYFISFDDDSVNKSRVQFAFKSPSDFSLSLPWNKSSYAEFPVRRISASAQITRFGLKA